MRNRKDKDWLKFEQIYSNIFMGYQADFRGLDREQRERDLMGLRRLRDGLNMLLLDLAVFNIEEDET